MTLYLCFRNILTSGLCDPVYLPDSNRYDTILCGCIIDVDFDGENEILIGTYGQVCRIQSTLLNRSRIFTLG